MPTPSARDSTTTRRLAADIRAILERFGKAPSVVDSLKTACVVGMITQEINAVLAKHESGIREENQP